MGEVTIEDRIRELGDLIEVTLTVSPEYVTAQLVDLFRVTESNPWPVPIGYGGGDTIQKAVASAHFGARVKEGRSISLSKALKARAGHPDTFIEETPAQGHRETAPEEE